MNEKKEALLEQLERMKEGATNSLANGGEYYIMHAECAVKFATEAIELLMDVAPQEAPTKPGFVLRRPDGKTNTAETECVTIMYIGPDAGECINSLNASMDDIYNLIRLHQKNIKKLEALLGNRFMEVLENASFMQAEGGDGDESK